MYMLKCTDLLFSGYLQYSFWGKTENYLKLIGKESSLGQDVVELHVLAYNFYFRKFMQRTHGFRPMALLEKSASKPYQLLPGPENPSELIPSLSCYLSQKPQSSFKFVAHNN
jgi:hypothetical protein